MADTHETIADIIAEKRRRADELEASSYRPHQFLRERIAELRQEANRLEAAHKRERGDCAKLREALVGIRKEVYLYAIGEDKQDFAHLHEAMLEDPPEYKDLRDSFFAIAHLVEAALAAPARNCDVGTAEEQDERFHRFCVKHHTGSCAGCHNPVGDYTVANGVRECALVWAQMPYEEGGAK